MNLTLEDLSRVVARELGDGPWLVALGGGADSSVLLAACVAARNSAVRAVFVNHGLDGSPSLRASAEALTLRCNVPLTVVDAVVFGTSDLEARARDARYEAIEAVLSPGEVCATGHTGDDQAETVLMRLARGSGSVGLSGIPFERGPFRRPFLHVSRADVRSIAIAEGLPFTDDPANDDDRFLRNRIRTAVLPVIVEQVGPEVRDNFAMSASLIGEDDRFVEDAATAIPIASGGLAESPVVSVPVGPLVTSPRPVASRAVRRALLAFHDPYRGSHADVNAVLTTAADGTKRNLTGDVVCAVEQGMVVLASKQAPTLPNPVEIEVGPLEAPAQQLVWGSQKFNVYRSVRPALASTEGRRTALADTDELMRFVPVNDGDRIEIDGGSARVVELLRNAGVPARIRPFWLAVTINGKIAAVHGIRVASWARPVPGEPAIIIEREGPL